MNFTGADDNYCNNYCNNYYKLCCIKLQILFLCSVFLISELLGKVMSYKLYITFIIMITYNADSNTKQTNSQCSQVKN